MLQIDEGNSILKNLDTEIDNQDMPSDVDEDDPDEDPEMLAELEKRQEDLIEEFLVVRPLFGIQRCHVDARHLALQGAGRRS